MNKDQQQTSISTLIYWLIQDKKIEAALLFNLLELFWPTFIRKNNYIFLKETFNEAQYKSLQNDNTNPEYWMNLLTVDEFFSEMPDWEEKASAFAKTLVSIWSAKLKQDFPNVNFTVIYLCNEQSGDYGITFYQTDKNTLCQINSSAEAIATPHIKENKLELSSKGPRPGIPRIRKVRADEIP